METKSASPGGIPETVARARALTREYYMTAYEDAEKRRKILAALLGGIGNNVVIDTPFHCNLGKNIFIGDDVIINLNCTFIDDAEIRIGSRVLIASNVQFYTATHPTDPWERMAENRRESGGRWYKTLSAPIAVRDGAWIGGGAVILPGVVIGENSVIGAGSVVTRSVPPDCVAAGNPCRPIRFPGSHG